jgi:hypothetical protein
VVPRGILRAWPLVARLCRHEAGPEGPGRRPRDYPTGRVGRDADLDSVPPEGPVVPSENIIRKSLCFKSSFKFPVRTYKFPVPLQKFPVPVSREFRCKALNLLVCQLSKSHLAGGFAEIPC